MSRMWLDLTYFDEYQWLGLIAGYCQKIPLNEYKKETDTSIFLTQW